MSDTRPYRPSAVEVEAAIAAWNRAEPRHPLVGTSWHATVAEMLIAAHAEPPNPHLPAAPADGQHRFEGRCLFCGAYPYGEEAERPCEGEYRESSKMRSWAARRWAADRAAAERPDAER